jgi:hypothetical protein
MIRFANDEFMFEFEAEGRTRQYLELRPSGVAIYSGLAEDESPRGGNNPFMFLDYAFAHPANALHRAYPSGPAAVPQVETETKVVLENKVPTVLTAIRESADRVRFRLTVTSGPAFSADGIWDAERRAPLPDDLSLAGWRHDLAASPATLGEARALPKGGTGPR